MLGYVFWFAFGMGLALVSVAVGRDGAISRFVNRYAVWLWLAAGALFAAFVAVIPPVPNPLSDGGRAFSTVAVGLIALLILIPAIFGNAKSTVGRFLSWRICAWLGLISYGIFVWRRVVVVKLDSMGVSDFVPLLLVTLAITIGLAAASYYLVERPALKFKYARSTKATLRSSARAGTQLGVRIPAAGSGPKPVPARPRLSSRLGRRIGSQPIPAPIDGTPGGPEPGHNYPSEPVSDAAEPSEHRFIAPIVDPDDERRFTDSGIEVGRLYDADDVAPDVEQRLGEPGSFPFTRGIHDGMYRDRLWTMRQYAGFSSPEDTNERYRYLIEHGSTGLSMAFDLPTQLGRDSDDPLCDGEVGRTGVPIDTIEDMRICFDQIPLDQVSTSMTINAPAAVLLLLYELVGEEQDVASEQLRGTVQNDVLKEYMARGNYIYPPEPTMRLTTDIFEYCQRNVPKWNTISISGYHIREKGCSAVQEVAFTLANAIAYVEAALARGLDIDAFAPRLAFFFNCHNNVFQEVAKFRAVRRMWAEIVRDRFGSENPRSQMIRFHTQTGGVTLQAQQPEVNIIRVALQGFAAVAGGTQSLHTNGFDEALALPTERSARIALRTQQVIAYESGATETVDPFAGSYFIESLTDEIEMRAKELMTQVEEMGGSVESLDFMQREIEESAASYHERYKSGQDIIVGVNKFVTDTIDDVDILKVDPEAEKRQVARLAKHKQSRDQAAVDDRLADLTAAAEGDVNLLPPMKEALRAGASIGEVCGTLREVFGEYRGGAFF